MYKYIIFDYDGTLVNSLPHWLAGYIKILKEFGIIATKKQVVEHCFGQKNGVVNLGIKDPEFFYKKLLNEVSPKAINYPDLFLGVKITLKKLNLNNINLSIVSSSSNKTILEDFKNKNIANYFDLIIGYEDVSELKPNPEGIYKIMDFYNDTNPKNYLFVGDSYKDLQAAKNAGVDFCLFKNYKNKIVDGGKIKSNTEGLTYSITRYSSLLKLVK